MQSSSRQNKSMQAKVPLDEDRRGSSVPDQVRREKVVLDEAKRESSVLDELRREKVMREKDQQGSSTLNGSMQGKVALDEDKHGSSAFGKLGQGGSLGGKLRYITAVMLLAALVVVSGCTTLPTNRTSFPEPSPQADVEDNRTDARALLEQALHTMENDEKAQSYWFNGHILNSIQNRTITSMYQGVALRNEDAYFVNGRIAAQPYTYYSYGDQRFMRRGSIWYRLGDEELTPYEPFSGFSDWLPLLKDAKQLPNSEILSNPTHVVEVRISALEWAEHSPHPLFDDLKQELLDADEDMLEHLLDNTVVKMTLWIGIEDHYIYQYNTWIVMPLPGAGYFDQETNFRFYRYHDPSIPTHISDPEQVERWVLEAEEEFRAGELEDDVLQ